MHVHHAGPLEAARLGRKTYVISPEMSVLQNIQENV